MAAKSATQPSSHPPSSPAANNDLISSFRNHKVLTLGTTPSKQESGKIESLYAYADKILVGMSTGTLLVYTIADPLSPNPGRATLAKTLPRFAPRAIEKMGVVKDAGSLIVLADSVVYVYDMETWTLDETLGKTKGATTFEIMFGVRGAPNNSESHTPDSEQQGSNESGPAGEESEEEGYLSTVTRLVVAAKRKLLCYKWQDSEFVEFKEVVLPDKIRSLSFVTVDKVVMGLNSDYCIVDLSSFSIINITLSGTHSNSSRLSSYIGLGIGGRSPFPHSIGLPDATALLVKDTNSEFIDQFGKLITDGPVFSLTAPLEHLGYSYPYIITVASKSIEVRNPSTFSLLQTIEIPNIKTVHWGKVSYIATANQVYLLQSTSLESQVKTLAENNHLSEAVSILESIDPAYIPDKSNLLRSFKIKQAQRMLVDSKEFEKALSLFSKVSAPPDIVINLFPKQISGSAADLIRYIDKAADSDSDSSSLIKKVHQRTASSVSGSGALSPRHKRAGKGQKSDPGSSNENSAVESSATSTDADSREGSDGKNESENGAPTKEEQTRSIVWSNKEVLLAIRYLVNYLTDTRRKISMISSHKASAAKKRTEEAANKNTEESNDSDSYKSSLESQETASCNSNLSDVYAENEPIVSNGIVLTPEIFGDLKKAADLVDTTIFKCYVIQSPALIGPLLRIHNHCDPATVKPILAHIGRWRELIDFYFGKKLHREALELLKSLAISEDPDSADGSESGKETSTSKSKKPRSVPEYLQGPEPTVQYIQRLNNSDIDLIFEYSKYPIEINKEFGVEIFLNDSTESESLDRSRVLNFLSTISRSLSIKYLEHLIHEKHEDNPHFHTALAIDYVKELGDSLRQAKKDNDESVADEPPTAQLLNQKYSNFGQQTSADAADAVKRRNETEQHAQEIFTRLVTLLQDKDSKCRLSKVLASLPSRNTHDGCLPQELEIKAILYGRQGLIRNALIIYTFALQDNTKARAFCSTIYDDDVALGKQALHTLMALYLTPPDYKEIDQEEANDQVRLPRSKRGSQEEDLPKHPPQRLDLALDLLATQGSRMSVVDIINTLPNTTTIQDISIFLTSQMRTLRTSWNNSQLDTALRKVNLVKTQELLLEQQQRAITVTPIKTCKVCYKRLGQSVISVFPDNTAIHYGCAKIYQSELDKQKEEKEKAKKGKRLEK